MNNEDPIIEGVDRQGLNGPKGDEFGPQVTSAVPGAKKRNGSAAPDETNIIDIRMPHKAKGPTPIDFLKREQVAPCPLELLPPLLRDFIHSEAHRMQVSPDLILIPALCVAGTLLGHPVRVQPMRNNSGWTERAAMWGLCAAGSGTKKSPAAKPALAPIEKLQERASLAQQQVWNDYYTNLAEFKAALKKDKPQLPTKPGPGETVLINSATREKIGLLMCKEHNANNARGMLFYADELAGWLNSFNEYKGGNGADRQFFLKSWSGGLENQERVKDGGSFLIPDMYLSICGGIQPGVAQKLFGEGTLEDGMVQRFGLAVMPDPLSDPQPLDIAPDKECIERYTARLMELRQVPASLVRFDPEAAAAFVKWEHELPTRYPDIQADSRIGMHFAKYPSLLARLALIWHFLEHGRRRPANDIHGAGPSEISLVTFEQVRRFIENYLVSHARRFYSAIEVHPYQTAVTRVAEWIVRKRIREFTARDIRKTGWSEFQVKDDEPLINAVLNFLEAKNWIELGQTIQRTTRATVNRRVWDECRSAGTEK